MTEYTHARYSRSKPIIHWNETKIPPTNPYELDRNDNEPDYFEVKFYISPFRHYFIVAIWNLRFMSLFSVH